MPLTWDITRCAESPDALMSDAERPVTETLIFATVGIGIGVWTEENIAEVYGRIHLMEAIYGPFMRTYPAAIEGQQQDAIDRPLTPEDIRRRIGLRTNVGKPETRASFIRRHCTSVVTDAMWQYSKTEHARVAMLKEHEEAYGDEHNEACPLCGIESGQLERDQEEAARA